MPHESVVYVIDDDRAMRESLEFLLDAAGFSVRVFDSAIGFLERASSLEFGCVVSDLQMPGINGMDLLRRLRSDRTALPVVLMTGMETFRWRSKPLSWVPLSSWRSRLEMSNCWEQSALRW